MMMSQISTFADFTKTQIFPSNKKINYTSRATSWQKIKAS